MRRGTLRIDDAVARYASVVKDGTLGMARLASAIPTEANDDDFSIPFIVTTLQEDRDGDVVIPLGCQLGNYKHNPVCYFGHQQYQHLPFPIAKCKSPDGRVTVYPEENLIRAVMYFDRNDPDAMRIYQKVKDGFLNATSIAFVPIEAMRRDREAEKGLYESRAHTHSSPMSPAGWLFKSYDLTEISVVGVPANAGAIRDWLDTDKGLSPRLQKSLAPYAAKALGRSFSGWCPPGTVLCPDGTCQVEKSAGGAVPAPSASEPPADEPDELPTWDAIVDGKAWGTVEAPNEDEAKDTVKRKLESIRIKQMDADYGPSWTWCDFKARFKEPRISVKGPYGKRPMKSKTVTKSAAGGIASQDESGATADFEYVGPIEQQPPQERWNKQLSSAFDAMPELLMSEPEKVGAATTHRVAAKYLGCQIKDLHQSQVMVPSPRMGSFLSGLKRVLAEYRCVETRNVGDRSEQPPAYETIQLNSKSRDNFLVHGTMFMESVAPRGKRANPRQMLKGIGAVGKGSGPHNGYGAGVGDKRFVVRFSPEWGGLNVKIITTRADAALNQSVTDRAWAWAKANNFLKGEAFALSGEFLGRTAEGWDDVFLEERNKRAVQRTLELFNRKGAEFANRGVILTGPPGTGKTLSGRIIRNQAKGTFIWVSSRDFHASGSVGGLSGAFDMAKELAPAIVFMEDVDNWLDGRSVDLLKSEMDGIARSNGVLTILTTNFPEQLPEALIDRPGRFHDVLNFDLPAEDARRTMLRKWLPQAPNTSIEQAVEKSAGYSGAHVYELAHFAKTLNEQDDLAPAEAVREALAKVEQQRELITRLQLAGSNYDPLRNSRRRKGEPDRSLDDYPSEYKGSLVTKGHGPCGCGGKAACSCGKKTTKADIPLPARSRGGEVKLPTRDVNRIYAAAIHEVFSGDHRVEELPEWSRWQREVATHYVKLRTIPERLAHRQALESAYNDLRSAARRAGIAVRSLDAQLLMPVEERYKSVKKAAEKVPISSVKPGDEIFLKGEGQWITVRSIAQRGTTEMMDIVTSTGKKIGVHSQSQVNRQVKSVKKETLQECVSRKVPIFRREHPDWKEDHAVAAAYGYCGEHKGIGRIGQVRKSPRVGDRVVVCTSDGNGLLVEDGKVTAINGDHAEVHEPNGRTDEWPLHMLDDYRNWFSKSIRKVYQMASSLQPGDEVFVGAGSNVQGGGQGWKVVRSVTPQGGNVKVTFEDGSSTIWTGDKGVKKKSMQKSASRQQLESALAQDPFSPAMAKLGYKLVDSHWGGRQGAYQDRNGDWYAVDLWGGAWTYQGKPMAKAAKQALAESSGTAGGYTVPVDQATGDVRVAEREAICQECGGSGECTGCGGAGEIDGRPCPLCGGSGECVGCAGVGMVAKSVRKGWQGRLLTIFNEGKQHFAAGKAESWRPYQRGTQEAVAWLDGWKTAKIEAGKSIQPKQPHNRIKNYVR